MTTMWSKTAAGLLVPRGKSWEAEETKSRSYLHIKEDATKIERLYAKHNLPIHPSCELGSLIQDAKTLSDAWLLNRMGRVSMDLLFRVGHLDRIAGAVLALDSIPNPVRYLKALTSGSLDLLDRVRAHSKNVLWEVELWWILKCKSLNAHLREPPDIVVEYDDSSIGLACKKIYSDKNIGKVLSEAVGQMTGNFDYGIAAFNLDDLIPRQKLLRVPDHRSVGKFLDSLNLQFLKQHERHFLRYLRSGRILSVLVSSGVLADVYETRTRFNNARQTTGWSVPNLSQAKRKQLERFYGAIVARS